MDGPGGNDVLSDSIGNTPDVSSTLEVKNRTVESVDQAFQVCETMVSDWKKGILISARITAKINGERPYSQKRLADAGKGWKTNISTGFLATECSKVTPRFYMPVKTAKYLTAAELPAGHADGQQKTQHFRQTITDAIRGWPKWNAYIRGASREVGTFGYCSNAWFDEYEWRPTMLRIDRGFVPQGTEIADEPMFFLAKWDYKPSELIDLVKLNKEAGRKDWNTANVVQALNSAVPPPVDAAYPEARSYEDLIRQATWAYSYTKGAKLVRTWHLFAKEATGKVSHFILLSDTGPAPTNAKGSPDNQKRLLYENLDQYDSMNDVVNTIVFDYGDGTIHGSWGAGQILYDMASVVEKIRCDSVDNMRLTNKIKANVPDAKNVNDVKLVINDQMVIVSGAQFAGSQAGMVNEISGYETLDQKLTQLAQQKIGAFVPPIPLQPSDIKAAQINAAMSKERELQEALLENWLIQIAQVIKTITKRITNASSPDEVAKRVVATLLEKLSAEEIELLINQFPVKSVIDFTEYKAQQRAAFAQSVMNNPLFKQSEVARIMAEGVGDERFVDSIVVPEGDQSSQIAAERQQQIENATMATGQPIKVLPSDNDWVHMQTLKPLLGGMLASPQPNTQLTRIGLQHYEAHYIQGVGKKVIPPDSINDEKSWIASAEKALAAVQQKEAIQKQAQDAGVGLPPPGAIQQQ